MTYASQGLLTALQKIAEEGFSGLETRHTSLDTYLQTLDVTDSKAVAHELRRQKLIESTKQPNGLKIVLTPKGAHRIMKERVRALAITPTAWDGRWRLVSFDIPKGKDKDRMFLYQKLKGLGFFMIQKSMWVHAFECHEQLITVADYCNLTRYITYFEVTYADQLTTAKLRRHFNV